MKSWRRWTVARLWLAASVLALSGSPALALDVASSRIPAEGTLQSAFSPWDDVEGLVVESLAGARRQVRVQAYLFTNRKIARALIDAQRRGVDVRVLADARQHAETPGSVLRALSAEGVPVWLETRYLHAHNKVIIIDPTEPRGTVITGSFNLTLAAQRSNAENVLIARDNPRLATHYLMNWERHQRGASRYTP